MPPSRAAITFAHPTSNPRRMETIVNHHQMPDTFGVSPVSKGTGREVTTDFTDDTDSKRQFPSICAICEICGSNLSLEPSGHGLWRPCFLLRLRCCRTTGIVLRFTAGFGR